MQVVYLLGWMFASVIGVVSAARDNWDIQGIDECVARETECSEWSIHQRIREERLDPQLTLSSSASERGVSGCNACSVGQKCLSRRPLCPVGLIVHFWRDRLTEK